MESLGEQFVHILYVSNLGHPLLAVTRPTTFNVCNMNVSSSFTVVIEAQGSP